MASESFERLHDTCCEELSSAMAAVPAAAWGGLQIPFDVYACFELDGPWAMAYLALDFFGTEMSDTTPFGWMQLFAPENQDGQVWLRLRVPVPVGAAVAFCRPLEAAVARVLRTLVGDASMQVLARPVAEES